MGAGANSFTRRLCHRRQFSQCLGIIRFRCLYWILKISGILTIGGLCHTPEKSRQEPWIQASKLSIYPHIPGSRPREQIKISKKWLHVPYLIEMIEVLLRLLRSYFWSSFLQPLSKSDTTMVLAFRKPGLALIFSMAFAIEVLTSSTTSSFSDKPTLSSSSSFGTQLHSFSNTVSSKPTTSPIPLNAFPNWISMSYESQQTNTHPVPTLPITGIPIWEESYASADNPYYINVFLDQNSALSSSCGAIWSTYFYEWMATADIKTMDPPFATSLEWKTSTGAVLYYGYDWTTSAALTITGSTF